MKFKKGDKVACFGDFVPNKEAFIVPEFDKVYTVAGIEGDRFLHFEEIPRKQLGFMHHWDGEAFMPAEAWGEAEEVLNDYKKIINVNIFVRLKNYIWNSLK